MDAEPQPDAIAGLLNEFSAALADVVETIRAGHATTDEIAATLADMTAAIEARKSEPLTELVAAVKALRLTAPAVNVSVSPTPIEMYSPQPLVQILERPMPYAYRIHDITKDRHGEITGALISPVLPQLP